jgi:RNA polymerase sigma-70 factor (ECF subfamily)
VSAALDAVLNRFVGLVRSVGARYRLPQADLDEVVQDVRVRLWTALGTSERIHQVTASYLHRAAMSAAVDVMRRRRLDREPPLDVVIVQDVLPADDTHGPEAVTELNDLSETIERALESIPSARRPVVRLYLSGFGSTEIATLMGWTEPKARNLLYRGLGDLRDRLRALGVQWDER